MAPHWRLVRPTRRLRWTGQSRAVLERQYLSGSFYFYHSFSVIVAQPLSFTLGRMSFAPLSLPAEAQKRSA